MGSGIDPRSAAGLSHGVVPGGMEARIMNRIEGKLALVTGGTRGIGLAIVRALLDRGARVFLCALHAQGVEEVLVGLQKDYRDRVLGGVCDVRRPDQVHSMFEKVENQMSGLDILVNNAGVGLFRYVAEIQPEEWQSTLETNLSGVFHCCREAIPIMKRRGGGCIINIASLAGKNAFPGGAAYNASKFGVVGFSEALMQEVRYDHIRVSYVMPGSVDTEFAHPAESGRTAAGKLLPEDVAGVVIHLLEMDPRALSSRVELRPSEPKK
jgi:NAD(P)-dependent dehydrogenase (short-subunit alcohol dehydrogenase family)